MLFTGFVQGVGFRYWAIRAAAAFDVTGYVRNLPDGSVEAVIEGPAAAVDRFGELLRQGPPAGRVLAVDAVDEAPRAEFDSFGVRY